MGDCLWESILLSLLFSVGQEMSTGKTVVIRCGWRPNAGWLIPFVDKPGWRVKLYGPSLTHAILSTLEISLLMTIARYNCLVLRGAYM